MLQATQLCMWVIKNQSWLTRFVLAWLSYSTFRPACVSSWALACCVAHVTTLNPTHCNALSSSIPGQGGVSEAVLLRHLAVRARVHPLSSLGGDGKYSFKLVKLCPLTLRGCLKKGHLCLRVCGS